MRRGQLTVRVTKRETLREREGERGTTVPVECLAAIAANTFSMHTITSSKLLAKLKLNYAAAVQGGVAGEQTLRYIVEHFIKLCR